MKRQRFPDESQHTYPVEWVEIATRIKNRAGWRCEKCGHVHEVATGYVLTVHHLDMDPANVADTNLVALCQRCHLHVQAVYVVGQIVFWAEPWLVARGYPTYGPH